MDKINNANKFKKDLTKLLLDIRDNCLFILDKEVLCDDMILKIELLIEDIDNVIIWYKNIKSKTHVLDYLRDYKIMDERFNNLVDLLPKNFYYGLCLLTNKLKVSFSKDV